MADDTQVTYLVIDASKAVEGGRAAQRALEALEKQNASTLTMLGRMEKALSSIGSSVKLHLALALTEAVARIADLARQSYAAVSGLAEMAEQMGTNARALQGMQFAAVQGGASIETLEGSIGKFSIKMGEAADGSKTVIDALKNLGVKNLDAQGNLRATEELLQEVATAILKIEDPARRAAAMVEFFGKSGRQLIPALKDFASGADAMAMVAEANKAMVSDETIEKLDKYADQLEKAKLKSRALAAGGLVYLLDKFEEFDRWMQGNIKSFQEWSDNLDFQPVIDDVNRWLDDMVLAGGKFVLNFVGFFAALPASLGKAMAEGMNSMLEVLGIGLTRMNSAIIEKMPWVARQLGMQGGDINLGKVDFGSNRPTGIDRPGDQWAANQKIEYALKYGVAADERAQAQARAAEEQRIKNEQDFWLKETTGLKPTSPLGGDGNKYSTPTGGGGDSPEKKYEKLKDQLRAAADAQDAMTAAAMRGDTAFQELKAKTDAQAKATEIFGHALADNDPRLKELIALMERLSKGKAAEAFALGTTELQKQNDILEKQIELINEEPEVQARAIAAIKAKQEAQKDGIDLEGGAYAARLKAIEQNEKLKLQQEQMKASQELWTEPLKTAFKDIQRAGADAWDQILQNGKISFSSLGDVFKTTIRRMIAEFLQLATIRPVMQVVVQGMNSLGLVSGQTMSQMGYSPSSGGGGMFSGLSNMSMPSWLGGGTPFSFLNEPIFGGGAVGPAGMMGAPTGASGLSGFAPTWGAGLGALAGAGMGVYQLLSGNGSASSTIGGISSIVGAGLSLIPGIGPFLGAGVGLLGNLLPGLFGMDQPPTITNQTYGQLRYGDGGWFTNGGAWGPSANSGDTERGLAGLGGSISSVFNLLGGVKDSSKVWGLSAMNKTVSGQGWSSSSDSVSLVDPSGNQQLWRMNESNMMDTASAQVAYRSILEGAVGEISENLRVGLTKVGQTMGGTSLQTIAETVSEIMAFDEALKNLGKTVLSSEDAMKQIDNSFASLFATADKYGLSTSELDAGKLKARLDYANSFGTGLSDQLLQLKDPQAFALQELDKWKADLVSNNEFLLKNVEGALDQINKIEELYGLKRAEIVKQSAEDTLTGLEDVLKELTMSGMSPADQVSNYGDTYRALLARADTDTTARGQLGAAAKDYIAAMQSAYGSGERTEMARRGVIADLAGLTLDVGSNDSVKAIANMIPVISAISQQIQVLLGQVAETTEAAAARDAEVARLTAMITRLVNNTQPG